MAEPAATFKDGAIYWRGSFRTRDEAIAQAERFEAITDWFAPAAQEFAGQLRRAIQQYDRHHQ